MTKKLRIAIAQLNFTVGDIAGNLKKHIDTAKKARDELSADLIVFSELSLTGYPPEDLLLRPAFIAEAEHALQQFMTEVKNIYCVVGHPFKNKEKLFNACSVIYNGEIVGRYAKQHLPNYGVFDEDRYFTPGNTHSVTTIKDVPVGIVICEDVWFPAPIQQAALQGARIIVSPNASPFETDKHEQRLETLNKRAKANKVPIVYANQVGGQDDLIFDGDSMVVDAEGKIVAAAGFCEEDILVVDFDMNSPQAVQSATHSLTVGALIKPNATQFTAEKFEIESRIYRALVLALKDYIEKNHFPGVLIGVSGGIDSALTLAIAVDALGKDRVRAAIMPSHFTSNLSMEEALAICANLQVEHDVISIESTYEAFLNSLSPVFANTKPDVTEENIQARCRAILIMALSNKTGWMVVTTGNRSEIATGYCTLYGDMAGGFAVLKDVPKTLVYRLANYRNTINPIIPPRTITRAPTAELAPNQTDQDTLPPYETLDAILECYLNQQLSIDDIVAKGFDRKTVERVVNLVRINEYKRRQSAIGPRINHTAFSKDRRYPITNGWKK